MSDGRDATTKGRLDLLLPSLHSQHPPMKCSNILVYSPSLLGSKFYQVDKGNKLDFKVKWTVELEANPVSDGYGDKQLFLLSSIIDCVPGEGE